MQTDAAAARDGSLHTGSPCAVGRVASGGTAMDEVPSSAAAETSQQPRMDAQRAQIGSASQLLAGGIAGAVSKTCTAPLARLTIIFQVQGMQSDVETLGRPSIIREASKIAWEEGLRAFWKGNGVTIVHRLPYSAISFYCYEKYKMLLLKSVNLKVRQDSLGFELGTRLLAGGAAGITAASLTYPLDLIRTRLAAQRKEKYYRGISHALRTIHRDEGLKGLYKGMGATLLGVGPNIAINFCVYETLKSMWAADEMSEWSGPWTSLFCGSMAGLASSTASFPLDLVRRRMQLEGAAGRAPVYKTGLTGTFLYIMKTEGWAGLYRGILPEYLKVIPSVGIVFMTYEFMRSFLSTHLCD